MITTGNAPTLVLAYQYNLLGEVTDVTKKVGSENLYEKFQYNNLGQLVRTYSSHVPLNDLATIQQEEDDDGALISTTVHVLNPKYLKLSTEYNLNGQVSRLKFSKMLPGITATGSAEVYSMRYQYDLRDRLTQINNLDYYYTNQDHFGLRLAYDKSSRITSATTLNPGASNFAFSQHRYEMRYQYDDLNRLKDSQYFVIQNYANPNGTYPTEQYREQLSYDLNGNITNLQRKDEQGNMMDNLSYSYASNSNRLNQLYENVAFTQKTDDAESTGFTYDKNGNILSGDGVSNLQYDVRNLPTQLLKNGQTLRFRYNASGQRIYKDGNSGKEHYLMNGSELIAVWKEGAGLQYWQTSYGRYQPNNGTYTSYYYVKDHLGSTRVVLNEAGQRTEATDYYAFGMKMGGRSYYQGTKDGYTTKERDAETGWDYFGARYYNPSIGRFNGIDRFADKYPYFTPFQYAGNNPMSFIDVNGDSLKVTNGVLDWENNATVAEAFKSVLLSKDGKAFLSKYAKKGQTILGVTFDEDGEYHKKGMHLKIQSYSLEDANGTTTTYENWEVVTINSDKMFEGSIYNQSIDANDPQMFKMAIMERAKTLLHELFLHAGIDALDYVDNRKHDRSSGGYYKGLENSTDNTAQHAIASYGLNPAFPGAMIRALNEANQRLQLGLDRSVILQGIKDFHGYIEPPKND